MLEWIRRRLFGPRPSPIGWGGFGLSSPPLESPAVRRLQERLGVTPADGVYGEQTAAAVAEEKRRLGLDEGEGPDRATPELLGQAGPMTTWMAALQRAVSQLGYKESPAGSNRTKFGDWYGMDGQPWCAMFVTWAAVLEGSTSLARGSRYAYCPYIESDARAGRYGLRVIGGSNGDPGDIVTFDWEGDGLANHVGFVEKNLGGGSYQTIEGNTSQQSNDNGGEVQRRTRSAAEVSLVVRYPNEAGSPPPAPDPAYWPLHRLSEGEAVPPDYLIRYPTNPEGTSAENYAVYPSGIVRRVAGAERAYLADDLSLEVIEMTDEAHRDRLAAVDAALRGK